jgi:methionyl-tRNA formyltransferase
VDRGIDTGKIIYQSKASFNIDDNFFLYPIRQYVTGIPLVLRAVSDVLKGELVTQNFSQKESKIWQHPTLVQYLSIWIRLGVH